MTDTEKPISSERNDSPSDLPDSALRKSEEKYRKLFDSIDEGFCIMEKVETTPGEPSDFRYLETNPAFEQQSGMKNAVGKTIREILPDVDKKWIETYDRVLETGEPIRFEVYLSQLDRVLSIYAFKTGSPKQQRIAVLFNDISGRKQTEKRLRESNEHFQLAVEMAQLGTWRYDVDSDVVHLDKRMCSIWGELKSGASVPLADVIERVHPDDRLRVTEAIRDALDPTNSNDSYSISYPIVWDDGSIHWVSSNGQVQFKEEDNTRKATVFFGTALDITEQKQAEEKVRESEERLQIVLEAGKLGSWQLDLIDNILTSSNTCKANFGLSPNDDLSYERLQEMIHPDDHKKWLKAVEQAVDEHIDLETELRIIWPNDDTNWVFIRGRAFYKKDGTPSRMIGVTQNITERKRNEERLITLKNKLDSDLSIMTRLHELSLRLTATSGLQPMLEEVLGAAIELQNADFGSIQLYNDETGTLELFSQQGFGQEFEEFYEKTMGMGTACDMALEEGRRVIIEDVETDPRYKDNRHNSLRFGYQAVQSTPLFDRAGNVLGMLSTHFKKPHSPSKRELRFTDLYARQAADMIDIKLSEERLRRSEEKLQSINETLEERVEERTSALLSYQNQLRSLATQLSKAEEQERQRLASDLHDNLGQILAVCKIKIDLLQKDEYDSEIAEASELVDEAIRYTRELMSDLKPPPSLDEEDLKTAMEWVAKKMEKHDLAVTVEDDDQPKPLSEEVRTTILRSARELLFNVVKHADVNKAWVMLSRVDDQVKVTVEDKGKGFDVDERKSVESLDEGFGLFNISERIDLLEGSLEIVSKPGKGTKVILTAPVLKDDEDVIEGESSVSESSSPVKAPGRTKRALKIKVLLVDDHQIMREGLRKIIEGEEDLAIIAEASDGKEAVRAAKETSPDVIVMDVNMPELNGILATQEIKAALPHVHIIGLSLHDDEDVAREMRNVGASAYLTKSDAFETLCATIRSEAGRVINDEF